MLSEGRSTLCFRFPPTQQPRNRYNLEQHNTAQEEDVPPRGVLSFIPQASKNKANHHHPLPLQAGLLRIP